MAALWGVRVREAGDEVFTPSPLVVMNVLIREVFEYVDERAFPRELSRRIKGCTATEA
ncbi:MAG: hypothetical protein SWK76_00630 [Actinomycetota bacterium]|nr:hypothetical protein [Actinomycetota bacterium]